MTTRDKLFETLRQLVMLPLAVAVVIAQFADVLTTDIAVRSGAFPGVYETNPIVAPWLEDAVLELYVLKLIVGALIGTSCYAMLMTRRLAMGVGGFIVVLVANYWTWDLVVNNMRNMGLWL
jgi:hypothetical protein